MLRLSVSVAWGDTIYWKHVDADIPQDMAINNFIKELIRNKALLSQLETNKIDSGHFIYKLFRKLRQGSKPILGRFDVEGVREAASGLTEKEKQVQHALGLLPDYDIVICCYNLDDYDMM